jgi:type VI secretion system protein VasD
MPETASPPRHCPAPSSEAMGEQPGPLDRHRRAAGVALGLAVAASLPSCGMFAPPPPPPPPPPKPPPKLDISVVAAANVNPDIHGRPSPVTVRLYEFKSSAQFIAADFMALFDQDKTVLAGDIVVREEFVLRPGETKTIAKLLAPETLSVGVMAAFRDLERARWRDVVVLSAGKDNTVVADIKDVFVKLTQSAKDVPAKR